MVSSAELLCREDKTILMWPGLNPDAETEPGPMEETAWRLSILKEIATFFVVGYTSTVREKIAFFVFSSSQVQEIDFFLENTCRT